MPSTRDQIIQTTSELLETQGYHATGLNQIVAESGSPKGSLYYYFPQGKEGLTAEAIARTGTIVAERIRSSLAEVEAPGEAIQRFLLIIAEHVRASDYRAGGPITAVALETASLSERLNRACREAYSLWHSVFQAKLAQGGFPEEQAARLATLVMASIEGAVTLSRTHRSLAPLEQVAGELRRYIEMARTEVDA